MKTIRFFTFIEDDPCHVDARNCSVLDEIERDVMKNYVEARNPKELCKLLGLPPSAVAKVEIRLELVTAIRRELERRKLTHVQAAKKTGIGRTVITAIVNGNLTSISIDRLIDVAQGLGLRLHLKVA